MIVIARSSTNPHAFSQCFQRLFKTRQRCPHSACANLPDPRLFMGDTGIDEWRNAGFYHATNVQSQARA